MFVVTPRFSSAYEAPQCSQFGGCAPASRAPYARRPDYSAFNHFFSQVDGLLSDMARDTQRRAQLEAHVEAHREALRQRQLRQAQLEAHAEALRQQQQRPRPLRASFAVRQNDQGWQLDGDIQGFAQENINIDVVDEHTLKITGNTQWQSAKPPTQPEIQQSTDSHNSPDSDTESESESHKSYQPTVEDDYEDLGADTSSLVSASSGTSSAAPPPAKEEATESQVARQPRPEPPAQVQQPQELGEQDRLHGTFERTFRFPQRIDAARVSANFTDGALRITIPKAQIPQFRRIVIS